MKADKHRLELNRLTEQVIGYTFKVGKILGIGFLQQLYENTLVHELGKTGLLVEPQKMLEVWYDGLVMGNYRPDLLVENYVIFDCLLL